MACLILLEFSFGLLLLFNEDFYLNNKEGHSLKPFPQVGQLNLEKGL